MSDELSKIDHMIENTTRKIGQQIFTLKEQKPAPGSVFLSIGGASLPDYVKKFKWDPARYSTRLSVQELAKKFQERVGAIDDEYKSKLLDYSNVANLVTQYERSLKANLTVRDLSEIVDYDDMIDTDYLQTLFVVCTKQQELEWQNVYSSLETDPSNTDWKKNISNAASTIRYVVPGSLKRVTEEGDQVLLSFVVLKNFKELLKTETIKHGVTLREVKLDKENSTSGRDKYQEMKKDMKAKQVC